MSQGTPAPRTAADMVAEARSRVECLTPEAVADELREGALLVDLRESEERSESGAIPGALHAPRGMLEFWADPTSPYHRNEFNPARRIILHCASGGRSALAADLLQQMGYQRIAHLEGGIKAWKDRGQSIQPPAPAPQLA